MTWSLPAEWILPQGEMFYQKFKRRGEMYSMTEPDWKIAEKYLTTKRIAVDVGAYVGQETVRYAENFLRVISFEPLYHEILEANVRHLDNVLMSKVALSNQRGMAEMVAAAGNTGASAIINEDNEEIIRKSKLSFKTHLPPIRVPTHTLDSYQLDGVDFIKIDTEGHVLPVLEGAIETLKENNFPLLQIELNKLNPKIDECHKFLNDLGYELVETYHVDHFFKHKS